ncbi:MAG: putative tricarboxylic transport rane protein [Alphaproteobacteria bacterium]|nr:putative tricarboxylic transport rane protein [Alphaproteobacteria bacterium]
MRMSEVVPPLLMLALSAVVVFGTWHLGYWSDTTAGPAFAPVWIAAVGALLAILQLRAARSAGWTGVYDWPDAVGMKRVAVTFSGLIVFSAVSPILGMVACVALFVFLFLWGLLARPLVPSLFTAAVTTGLVYLVFVRWLSTGLPAGIFGI